MKRIIHTALAICALVAGTHNDCKPIQTNTLHRFAPSLHHAPMTVKLLCVDKHVVTLPLSALHLFPLLAQAKQTNFYITLADLPQSQDPWVSLNKQLIEETISLTLTLNHKQRCGEDLHMVMRQLHMPEYLLESMLHLLCYLQVDQSIVHAVASALVASRGETESFLKSLQDGTLDLSIRWHAHPDWRVLNLSDTGLTRLSDIGLCVDAVPCKLVEVLSLKNNTVSIDDLTIKTLDNLYKLFPNLKQLIIENK